MSEDYEIILSLLEKRYRLDYNLLRKSTIQRRIERFMRNSGYNDLGEFRHFLDSNPDGLSSLHDFLLINASSFYREPLTFNLFEKFVLPSLFHKAGRKEMSIRIWSAGCAAGEEPYTISLLCNNFITKLNDSAKFSVLGSDIDNEALGKAVQAVYPYESIKELPVKYLNQGFQQRDHEYILSEHIKKNVRFVRFDLTQEKLLVPPETLFADFETIFCRNVLIYYETDGQRSILNKCTKAVVPGGYLILGQSELLLPEFQKDFIQPFKGIKIFRKKA
ncbi:MAG: protein-glutamate O-methyltransferase [Bacteroidales bacterium]